LPEEFGNQTMRHYQTFLLRHGQQSNQQSNSMPLWDLLPKYGVPRNQQAALRDERGDLPVLEQRFEYLGQRYSLYVEAARVMRADGLREDVYPSEREQLVESALRYLASQHPRGFYTINTNAEAPVAGVVFSVHEIRQLLAKRGRHLTYRDIRESLYVMLRCYIEVDTADRTASFGGPIITGVQRVAATNGETVDGDNALWRVVFNSHISQAIAQCEYRQFDFDQMVRCKAALSRWLYLALVHRWRNASPVHPLRTSLQEVARDSGFLGQGQVRKAASKLDKALDELKRVGVLRDYDREEQRGSKNKLLDVKYTFHATPAFSGQVIDAHLREKRSDERDLRRRNERGASKGIFGQGDGYVWAR
jgi:hypothetical protein